MFIRLIILIVYSESTSILAKVSYQLALAKPVSLELAYPVKLSSLVTAYLSLCSVLPLGALKTQYGPLAQCSASSL